MKTAFQRFFKGINKSWAHKPLFLTIVVVLLLFVSITAVFILDNVENKYALRMDFSFNSVTSQSEQVKKAIKSLPYPVHAYAIFTPGQEDQALLGLLNRFAAESSKFTYSKENLVSNPLLANTISSKMEDQAVSSDSLLIICETTGRTRVLTGLDYLSQTFDMDRQTYLVDGLQYEKAIAEALIYVSQESVPTVYILEGHGELNQEHTQAMEDLLTSHHYQTQRINLQQQTLQVDDSLMLVFSPQIDLSKKELSVLTDFVKQGGSMLITTDYSDPDNLANFDALYRTLGFERKAGIVVADIEDRAAYIDNPLFLTPYMQVTDPTNDLIASAQTRLRMPGARAIEALEDSSSRRTEPLLLSGQAYIKTVAEASKDLSQADKDPEGQFSLALLSLLQHADGITSKAAIIGNSAMLVDTWLYEITYSTQFLLQLINYLSPQRPINLSIAPKALVREQLQISSLFWPALIVTALPVVISGFAATLLIHRKKRG